MRIKLKKRAEKYKPVKGNELEIIKHLLDHNFHNSYNRDKQNRSRRENM